MHNLFPQNHIRLHSHKTRAWKPTHTRTKHTHTRSLCTPRDIHSQPSHSLTFSHLQVASIEEKRKNVFPLNNFFSARVPVVCAHEVLFLFIFRFACAPSSHNLSTSERRRAHHMNDVGTRTPSHCEDCVSCTTHARPNSLHSLLRRGLHVKQQHWC